jgi:tRNA nucleotidyltransferase/poly(A) polymerase
MEDDVLFYDRSRLKPFNEIFEHVSDVGYERFEEVYVVGGFVRDLIIGRDNHDLDFAIIGDALEFAKDLATSLGLEESAVTLFKNFGTAHF